MTEFQLLTALGWLLFWIINLCFMARAVLRPHRDPASRIAWVVVMAVLPVLGIVAYMMLGETNIGRRRAERVRQTLARLPALEAIPGMDAPEVRPQFPERFTHLFQMGRSVNGFAPIGGNRGRLMADSNATINAMVADIDAAREHVHLTFYIWLPDGNGLKMVEALKRAAGRGVVCRAMADGLGSRTIINSTHWDDMRRAGVHVATALPIGNLLVRAMRGRIDLRNHRKILVVDNQITYCGSQNCADPEFRVKAKFAPWVDAMVRFEGPIARQNQMLFAANWMDQVNEDLSALLLQPLAPERALEPWQASALTAVQPPAPAPFTAQVIGTGPTVRHSAMPEVFATLAFAARRELFITTPYYVPDEAMQAALCATALRGVPTTIIFPARNDSWIVAAASRSYYASLLTAGVRIFEYQGGLLHTKSLTLDGEVALIGSANMDRRSFDLNYENNILLADPTLVGQIRARQAEYMARCHPVLASEVDAWPMRRRLWNNAIAMLGPVL